MAAGKLSRAALLLASVAVAVVLVLAASGCGSRKHASEVGRRLQREDLVATARELDRATAEVTGEVTATKAAWPLVVNGLAGVLGGPAEAKVAAAASTAAALKLPPLFGELRAQELTGPSSSIIGDFRSFAGLSSRGWQMIEYALNSERRGGSAANFATANVGLYIESVYDAHFGLAQIGKKLLEGWEKLGGPTAFGASLPRVEVERLAGLYSEQNYRLQPHEKIKLGS